VQPAFGFIRNQIGVDPDLPAFFPAATGVFRAVAAADIAAFPVFVKIVGTFREFSIAGLIDIKTVTGPFLPRHFGKIHCARLLDQHYKLTPKLSLERGLLAAQCKYLRDNA